MIRSFAGACAVAATLLCLLCALSVVTVQAAPSISGVSGTVTHGQPITISGANFGTHSNYNNLSDTWQGGPFLNFRFKDFEDNQFESDGMYTGFDDSRVVMPSGGHVGHYGHVTYGTTEERVWFSADNSDQVTGTFYSSFWFMVPPNCQSGKFFRHYFADGYSFFLGTGCDNTEIRGGTECGATQWGSPNSFIPGQWHHVEVLAQAAQNDLDVTVWMDCQLQWQRLNWCTSMNYSPAGHTWDLTNMIDEPGSFRCPSHPTYDGSYNYDDIYFDYTQARVELGDASTFGACRHREVQLPETWNSSSITANVNAGSFPPGSSVYLYVVDSNGNVNTQGYPVVLGGQQQPDTIPPADVTTLAVGSTTQTSATLTWTAVGDDGNSGTAMWYDLRYSTSPITMGNWRAARQVFGEPYPRPAGQAESFTITGLAPGTTYYFGLRVIDEVQNWSGISDVPSRRTTPRSASGVGSDPANPDVSFHLEQNRPNPFGLRTGISFHIPRPGTVRVEVVSLDGRRVALLLDADTGAGEHTVSWKPNGCAAGVYVLRVAWEGEVLTRNMILVR